MKGIHFLLSSLSVLGAIASPVKRDDRGSYTVSGLGEHKQAILDAGGNTLDLAIAMLETYVLSISIFGNYNSVVLTKNTVSR